MELSSVTQKNLKLYCINDNGWNVKTIMLSKISQSRSGKQTGLLSYVGSGGQELGDKVYTRSQK